MKTLIIGVGVLLIVLASFAVSTLIILGIFNGMGLADWLGLGHLDVIPALGIVLLWTLTTLSVRGD